MAELRANARHRRARTNVAHADVEPDAVREGEGMAEHQPLHVAVEHAAPALAREEGVADRDFPRVRSPVVIARRTDHFIGRGIPHDQRAARREPAFEQRREDVDLVAIG